MTTGSDFTGSLALTLTVKLQSNLQNTLPFQGCLQKKRFNAALGKVTHLCNYYFAKFLFKYKNIRNDMSAHFFVTSTAILIQFKIWIQGTSIWIKCFFCRRDWLNSWKNWHYFLGGCHVFPVRTPGQAHCLWAHLCDCRLGIIYFIFI